MSANPSLEVSEDDPVLLAIAQAPLGLPETEEEKGLVATAKADGRHVGRSDVEVMLENRARLET
jgi:hypothetical protein